MALAATQDVQPTRNLVIVHTPERQGLEDWLEIQRLIQERAPDIDVRIVENGLPGSATRRWQVRRPSLVFSASALESYRPQGGKVYAGQPMHQIDKTEELRRLAGAGLPVPRTVPFTPGLKLDEGEWGRFVVAKPTLGGGGRGIRLLRTKLAAERQSELTARFGRMLIQAFVEHIDDAGQPGGYRVLTLFGHELYAIYRARPPRARTLDQLADDPDGILAFNTDEPGTAERTRRLSFDADVIALARQNNAAFPERPVLGVDIVRETGSDRLVVMEANPSGRVWHLSSIGSRKSGAAFIESIRSQFGALSRAADLLIEKTRAEAR